ncbi:unnamed protein product [Prorocentrum cordatum]|uniref:Uncharacterized protein n=1 Tax=Prorocentrum cordatum TaxID=2364126 RepID=A0ABN9UE56_9DINO|nr:unnamed protein product [Polarella glacialis]
MERRRYNREEEGRGAPERAREPPEERARHEQARGRTVRTASGRHGRRPLSAGRALGQLLGGDAAGEGARKGRGKEQRGKSRKGGGGGKKADRRRELALSRAHQLTGRRARLRWGASGRPWIKRGASRGARARAALARPSFQGGNSSGGDPQAPGWVRPVLGLSRRCGRRRRGSRTRPRRCLETATTAALACSPSRGSGERARALPRRVSAGSAAAGAPARRRPWLPPSRPARPPEPTRQCADPGAGP